MFLETKKAKFQKQHKYRIFGYLPITLHIVFWLGYMYSNAKKSWLVKHSKLCVKIIISLLVLQIIIAHHVINTGRYGANQTQFYAIADCQDSCRLSWQLQTVINNCRLSRSSEIPLTWLKVGGKTMACLSGKGHGKKQYVYINIMMKQSYWNCVLCSAVIADTVLHSVVVLRCTRLHF